MDLLLVAWVIVGALFLGVPGTYFLYMTKRSVSKWNLNIDGSYTPSVAILIPVHNEEKIVRLKLENLAKVEYPKEKMEIIIANDSSTDGTLHEVNCFIAGNPQLNLKVFDGKEHLGKTGCLNSALKTVTADVVILSDADCFWPHDILTKALSYLSDPNVGAITGREFLLNPQASWVTLSEQYYDSTIQAIRIGESKVHSTIFFQGGFAAFKRCTLQEFNVATDDSGTALDIIQKHQRALLIPDTGFFTLSPTVYRHKVSIKIRRASHLQKLWARCLKLFLTGKLAFPKRIALPEIFLHIFSPLFFVAFLALSAAVMIVYPLLALLAALLLVGVFAVKKTRTTAVELIQNNLILLSALTSFITNRKFRMWKPIEESRFGLNEQLLREQKLI